MATSSVMLGSSSTTRTRAPSPALFTASMLPRLPVSLLGNECGVAWFWPPPEAVNRALTVHQARRQPALLEPLSGVPAHDDGRGRGDVGVNAGAGDHRCGAPGTVTGEPRGRVDYVVDCHAASGPFAHSRARRGDAARPDADRLLALPDRGTAVLARLDQPSVGGRLAGHRD